MCGAFSLLRSTVRYLFSRLIVLCDSNPVFAGDAIDSEAYVPRYLDETDSSLPAHPMSVNDRRRPQTTSHVSMRPDQLRDMIGDVVRESLQQTGVGNVQEPDGVTPPQHESYQIPRR